MNKSEFIVRVNGRGNAWPVFLGGDSNFYDVKSSEDLSNASFSLIQYEKAELETSNIKWEVLIDAGHHTVPFLVKNGNRIPEAVVLTHGHMDHTLGLEWVAHSKYFLSNKKERLSVYATQQVWFYVMNSYPGIERAVEYKELLPGKKTKIEGTTNLTVTAFPVFHGERAKGASMLFFENSNKKSVLFTGDMLCPLLRKKDFKTISRAQAVFIDSNNRFPYPQSNHGSIVGNSPDTNKISPRLIDWYKKAKLNYLITPHARNDYNQENHNYFEEFLKDYNSVDVLPHSVFDFALKAQIAKVLLIHYGGMEDINHYKVPELSTKELQEWVNIQAKSYPAEKISFTVSNTGDIIKL